MRRDALTILQAGISAADPREPIRRALADGAVPGTPQRVVLIAAGKGAAGMASALEVGLGDRIEERVLIRPEDGPDPQAARRALELASAADESTLVVVALSGGASHLMPLPADGLTLDQKQGIASKLMRAGATVRELNIVRKHLSDIKGGRLAAAAHPAPLVALVLSDVVGDPLDVIASGPTVGDPSTWTEACAVLRRLGVWRGAPASVRRRIAAGLRGQLADTPEPGSKAVATSRTLVVGNNELALDASRQAAELLGYATRVVSSLADGEAREAGGTRAGELLREVGGTCLLWGGETTVDVGGSGIGGRNQEVALAAAIALDGYDGVLVASVGTDGVDGPTDAAGAFALGDSVARGRAVGVDAEAALARNDSNRFFEALADVVRTGPTGTNVMDLCVGLVAKAP